MSGLYVLGAVLIALVLAALVAPLFREGETEPPLEEMEPEGRRRAALETLRELEFERESGKLTEEEYRRLRARYGRIVLEAEEEGAREPPTSCSGCGGQLEEGARFCSHCGRAVEGRPPAGPGGP